MARSVPASTWPVALPEFIPARPVHLAIPVPDLDPDIAFWRVVTVNIWPFTGPPTDGPYPKGWLGIDNTSTPYVCTVTGTPGTWVALTTGAAAVTSWNGRTGAVVLTAADVEALFTAAGQVFFGTGSGTGSLSDILAALETKFSAAGQLIVGTGSGTGTLLAGGTTGQTLNGVTGAAPAWGTPPVALTTASGNGGPTGSTGGTQTLLTTPSLATGTWLINWTAQWNSVAAGNQPGITVVAGTATATFTGQPGNNAVAQGTNTPTLLAVACLATVTVTGTLLLQGVGTNTGNFQQYGYTAVKVA
jgi:hypothetical protein